MVNLFSLSRKFLAVLNLALAMVGVFLVAVGSMLLFIPDSILYIDLLSNGEALNSLKPVFDTTSVIVVAWACIGFGLMVFIVSLCGCLGASFLSVTLLGVYIITLTQVIAIQLGIGVFLLLSPEGFKDTISGTFNTHVLKTSTDISTAWEVMQYMVGCCGVNSFEDYSRVNASEDVYDSCCVVKDKMSAASFAVASESDQSMYKYVNRAECLKWMKRIVNAENSPEAAEVLNVDGCSDKIFGSVEIFGVAMFSSVSVEIIIVIMTFVVCYTAWKEEKPV
ncbi:Tetraspanin-33 [Holothuria leucospilota]|uniref:Tetraspanin n=1 Tax=Holothuria leucospilota TaxID=206669 RepID=A0A9Q1BDT4_HOLLE|nr:Tetraspanin-33 [Holothuria leucospilota]